MGLRTILGLKKPTLRHPLPRDEYWARRADAVYLRYVRALASFIGRDARSLIDVGSRACPYLEWFDWVPRRVSVDIEAPYSSANVEGIKSDFLSLELREQFDMCLCLQTIEHVRDAKSFAQKLLATSPRVLISVPYLWPEGTAANHVQDPVDEAKVANWFGRSPDFSMIAVETKSPLRRMICYYDRPL